MRFLQLALVGVSAFAASALAQIKITKAPLSVQAGNSYTIEWSSDDTTTPVTILLREGPGNNLNTISTLTTTGTGGKFTWNVPSTIADEGDYAFQITQGTQTNYWGPIQAAGGTGTLTSSSSSMSSTSSASRTSSSSAMTSSSMSRTSSSSMMSSSSSPSSSSMRSTSGSSSSMSSPTSATTEAAPSDTGNAAQNLKSNAALALAAAAIAYIA